MIASKTILAAALAAVAIPGAASAGHWNRTHPARTEINERIRHQDRRIREERREGDLTRAQARSLRLEDRSVRAQEVADARADGHHGHLTRAQVRTLNSELNANSRSIGK
ncbi:hypothetical protein ABDK56_03230 [Sphingomonas sp. ASV193]|uniref:hypothetical protein n=1 Tax=Sphingomonas sp. ASV193 TaxID=3144405 RepID=UPI0032E90883